MQKVFAIYKRYFKSSKGENDPKTCRIIMEEKKFRWRACHTICRILVHQPGIEPHGSESTKS